ncbi:MAG: TlpA family protein disulfide reductase [Tannerellaceae bacterium]|jgi:peroxiredoxin|nr:TlpA family protein disulfide reductase [Tannerellaceae bacterium]
MLRDQSRFLKYLFLGSMAGIFFTGGSCTHRQQELHAGIWRAELAVSHDRQAPFLFEVSADTTGSTVLTLINGEEKVPLTGIYYTADTVVIPVEAYDALIKARISDNLLEGRFIKNYIGNDTGVPFRAEWGEAPRFTTDGPLTDISIDGRWDILFINEAGDTVRNVGIFKTANQIVTGSVLTNSGDLRFLEGALTADGVRLSAFSGLTPYYIELRFAGSEAFEGALYTPRGKTTLTGSRNERAALADAYSQTRLKQGADRLSFKLPDTGGQIVSLADEAYKGKVVIVSVLGTWCPNCLDETQYLAQWYKENKERGVEILGLAFERKDSFEYAKEAIDRLKKRYEVDYKILFAGKAGSESTSAVLPEIEQLLSYPTTFFINKEGKVSKIHTGFSGPATWLFYEEWIKEFNEVVNELLAL